MLDGFDLSTEAGRRSYARRFLRSPLGVPGIQTDTNFFLGMDDGFKKNERLRRVYRANARKAGINPEGKRYVGELARRPGGMDPAAWVPLNEGRTHCNNVIRKRGWSCEGRITVNPATYGVDTDDRPYKVADDIVELATRQDIERQGVKLTPKERRELKAANAVTLAGKQF